MTTPADELRRKYGQILRHWGLLDEIAEPKTAEEFAVTDLIHATNTIARPAILRAAAEIFRAESTMLDREARDTLDPDMARRARYQRAIATRLDRMAEDT